jgi:hypothetical protein
MLPRCSGTGIAKMVGNRHSWSNVRAFLTELARNTRGNTLAIMAIAIIPLAGMVGGGIDISRMYIVKTRLQHGCDAGALAGRKAMGGGNWVQKVNGVDNYPDVTAKQFFDSNFDRTAYGGTNPVRSFSENAGKVTGTVSATVPMTLMRIFGRTSETLSVNCDAEMRLPNTDVMFVLDVTGSMASKAVSTDPKTKIEALRSAVKCFYEIVARLDTDEDDCGSTPSGGVGNEVQVRFGFVPYDMNVNAGRLLPTSYFADQWPYQSRERTTVQGLWNRWEGTNTTGAGAWSAWENTTTSAPAAKSTNCDANLIAVPGDDFVPTSGTPNWPDNGTETAVEWRAYGPAIQTNYQRAYNSGNKTCYLQKRTRNILKRAWYTRVAQNTANAITFPAWNYKQVTLNVAGLKNGSDWNAGVTVPTGTSHSNVTAAWEGCVEERATVRQASYIPIPDDAHDLDIDSVPTSDPATQWGPVLNPVVFPRRASYDNSGARTLDTVTTFYQSYNSKSFDCPTTSKKLQRWDDATTFDTYVDSMWGGGNTYHDIGLIWGARLLSPTGIFRTENEFTPAGGEIQRHMIFMTDGESCTSVQNYQAYGIAWYDRRQTDPSTEPSEGCATTGTLTQQVNARTAALCKEIQNKNITLWVIWFGAANAVIEGQLKECAKPGNRYFTARNQDELLANFRKIATEISQLRLTN